MTLDADFPPPLPLNLARRRISRKRLAVIVGLIGFNLLVLTVIAWSIWISYFRVPLPTITFDAAIKSGNIDQVRRHVRHKDVNLRQRDGAGFEPLHWAARNGHVEIVRFLLEKGVEVNVETRYGETPLYGAAGCGSAESVRLLLSHGAIADTRGHAASPIHVAARGGHLQVIILLIEAGVNINDRDSNGRIALHHAADNDDVGTVKYLLEKGATVSAKDSVWETPLHRAVGKYYRKSENVHLPNGDSVPAYTDDYTVDEIERLDSSTEIAKLLVEHGADLNAQNKQGQTPLHVALNRGFRKNADVVRRAGASIDLADVNGITPKSLLKLWDTVVKDPPSADPEQFKALLLDAKVKFIVTKDRQQAFGLLERAFQFDPDPTHAELTDVLRSTLKPHEKLYSMAIRDMETQDVYADIVDLVVAATPEPSGESVLEMLNASDAKITLTNDETRRFITELRSGLNGRIVRMRVLLDRKPEVAGIARKCKGVIALEVLNR